MSFISHVQINHRHKRAEEQKKPAMLLSLEVGSVVSKDLTWLFGFRHGSGGLTWSLSKKCQ
jgi:hypothetical protein